MEELVFAIPTNDLWELITYNKKGFIPDSHNVIKKILQKGIFRKRSELEEDPSYKQIIPYAILSNKDSYFLFKRTSGQQEKRLHNKFSLGIGGHMNPRKSEKTNELYLINELKRELFEELKLLKGCLIENIEFVGFINDDTIPVGKVHIGLLYKIYVSSKEIAINETDKMTAKWVNKMDLVNASKEMETWTKIAFDEHIQDINTLS